MRQHCCCISLSLSLSCTCSSPRLAALSRCPEHGLRGWASRGLERVFAARLRSRARGLGSMVLGVLCVLVVGSLLASAPALAAAPETPEVMVESVTATSATFHGVLSPIEAAEPNNLGGTYKFLYRASRTECTGGSVTKPSALFFGGVHEEVFRS